MYEKWIADDKEDLKLTKDQIAELRAKIDAVQNSQESSSEVLSHKEVLLSMKEDVLSVSCPHNPLRCHRPALTRQQFAVRPCVPRKLAYRFPSCTALCRGTLSGGTISWYTVWWDTVSWDTVS